MSLVEGRREITSCGVPAGEPHLFEWLRTTQRLIPLLRDAAADAVTTDAARAADLLPSDDDLQRAADSFRLRHGISTAADTQAWLATQGLSPLDLECALERDLLVARFQDHLAAIGTDGHFAAHAKRYDRARLRFILASNENLAQELLCHLRDDGTPFGELAVDHSRHLSRHAGGLLGWVYRLQLQDSVADAVFDARPGDLVGPLGAPDGAHLYLVEGRQPAELNSDTRAVIRHEIYAAWLAEKLRDFDPMPAFGGWPDAE